MSIEFTNGYHMNEIDYFKAFTLYSVDLITDVNIFKYKAN
jgi:hypothetical protein